MVMTKADGRGVPVTTRTDAELASIDSFTARLLRLDRGAEAILEDARSFPDSPMVQLSAAAFCLLGQTHASDAAAHDFLDATAPLLASATERERRLHRLMTMWRGQDHLGALAEAEAITADWPRDLFTAKLAEFFYYVLGQQHEGPRFLAHMQRLAPANPGDPDLLGMLAFAQELCGNVTEAAASADKAIALEPRNPWAHHCIAHLHLRCGDTAEAVHALESFLPSWITSGRFAHCHNAWHLALAHLETLNTGRALEVFERHVWGFAPDLVFEQVDAIALLWRLELAGIDVGTRWQGLADKAAAHLN
jgi:tetratricopeptide (TPR) repeat protein